MWFRLQLQTRFRHKPPSLHPSAPDERPCWNNGQWLQSRNRHYNHCPMLPESFRTALHNSRPSGNIPPGRSYSDCHNFLYWWHQTRRSPQDIPGKQIWCTFSWIGKPCKIHRPSLLSWTHRLRCRPTGSLLRTPFHRNPMDRSNEQRSWFSSVRKRCLKINNCRSAFQSRNPLRYNRCSYSSPGSAAISGYYCRRIYARYQRRSDCTHLYLHKPFC